MIEIIKKDAKIIKEIFDKEKNISFLNEIEGLALITSVFNTVLFIISICFFTELNFDHRLIFSLFGGLLLAALSFFTSSFLMLIYNNKKNKNYPKNSGSLFLSSTYLIRKEKKEEVYNLYNNLSKEGEDSIWYFDYRDLRNESLKEIENLIFKRRVMLMKLPLFISYFNKKYKEDVQQLEVKQEELIYNKIKDILEKINEVNFNKYKEDIVCIIETLKSKKNQLDLFELIEELKEKYDEDLLNNKINLIKDKVIPKKEKNNKVLKSL
tara:strand:+ start:13251 stop:14051 length:801 start_codon:yes stop_codon:yes gene_type:complete